MFGQAAVVVGSVPLRHDLILDRRLVPSVLLVLEARIATARNEGDAVLILVASPDYLGSRSVPSAPADLRLHSVIAFTGLMPNRG